MLWSILLPLKVTFCFLVGVVTILTVLAPIAKLKRVPTFWFATIFSAVAFIPSCTLIMNAIDRQRFGVFEYATFDDVDDFRVERYLPATATDITIDKNAQGFRARYLIGEAELFSYLGELWRRHGDRSVVRGDEVSEISNVASEYFDLHFGDLGWPHLLNATEYSSPVAENGAGFFIFYNASEGVAYERAGYW